MIFSQKVNQRKYRMILIVFFIVVLLLSGYIVRQKINESILRPLEIRAEIQANFLEEVGLDAGNFAEVEKNIEPLNQSDSAETTLLKNGQVMWDDFTSTTHLQTVRQQLSGLSVEGVSSKVLLNGYILSVPLTSQGEDYHLVKYYSKSLFKDKLSQFYYWMALIAVAMVLIYYIIFKLMISYISRPLEIIKDAIERLDDNNHLFEYIPGSFPIVDELGTSVVKLKGDLRSKRSVLDSSEQRLTLLMGHLNLGVVLISNSGKIELMNSEAMNLLNIDSNTTQRSFQAVIKSYVLVDMINDVLSTHKPLSSDIEMYVPTSKYIDVNIIPYGQSPDKIESILVLLYDISQVRRLETVRTEFVSNASHELRTPVTAIKGFAETLLDGALQTPELAEKFVTIIANESNRLEVIINDILELSRVEKQSEPMMIKDFEIVTAVNNLIEFFYKRTSEKEISITVNASKAVMMRNDQHRIEQIFINLIDNAINYSDIKSEITISIEQVDDYVHFTVADTGIGIPEQDQERIFERFYRVDKGRSRNSGGTGLGLSIVRNLVRNMSGTIYVESEAGEGSVFHVELPLEQ